MKGVCLGGSKSDSDLLGLSGEEEIQITLGGYVTHQTWKHLRILQEDLEEVGG